MRNFILGVVIVLVIAAIPKLGDLSSSQVDNAIAQRDLRLVCHGPFTDGVSCVDLFGFNKDVDLAASEDVISAGGSYVVPTAAQRVNVVSTSVNDALAGTGARIVQVDGLDASYNATTEIVNLNGTSNVLTANSFRAINRLVVIAAGTGIKNAGVITATQQTSGYLLSRIETGNSISHNLVYTVPNGKKFYIYTAGIDIAKNAGGSSPIVTVSIDYFDPNLSTAFNPTTSGVDILIYETRINSDVENTHESLFLLSGAIREHSTVIMRITTDVNNTIVYGRMLGVLVDTE